MVPVLESIEAIHPEIGDVDTLPESNVLPGERASATLVHRAAFGDEVYR